MPKDKYSNFADLKRKEVDGVDYRIVACDRTASCLIMAPHGGKIEPATSEIAREIAGSDMSLYLFEGLQTGRKHSDLHITSHKFDEPKVLKLAAKSERIVAVHGRSDGSDRVNVWIGGLDHELIDKIYEELSKCGFTCKKQTDRLAGKSKHNICNRSRTSRGVQLEIPRSIRDDLVSKDERLQQFCAAIRRALLS